MQFRLSSCSATNEICLSQYYNESRHADVPVYQVVSPDGDSSCPGNTDEEENEQAQQGFLEAKGDDGIEIEVKVSVPNRINVLKISAQIWIWILAVFVNFMVTLAVFPAIAALVVSFDVRVVKLLFLALSC